jgi:hypothetical protein
MHCKYVKEKYYSLTGQKNPFRGPHVEHAWYKRNFVMRIFVKRGLTAIGTMNNSLFISITGLKRN